MYDFLMQLGCGADISTAQGWADSSTGKENDRDKLNLKDLLFFRHIPRTGGCTYFEW
jgi:hypothetical protein